MHFVLLSLILCAVRAVSHFFGVTLHADELRTFPFFTDVADYCSWRRALLKSTSGLFPSLVTGSFGSFQISTAYSK